MDNTLTSNISQHPRVDPNGGIGVAEPSVSNTGLAVKAMTHTMQIRNILTLQIHCDIPLNSLQCYFNGPIHTCSIFCCEFMVIFFTARFFCSRPLLIVQFLCNFVLQQV